jgi:hypothetical protein
MQPCYLEPPSGRAVSFSTVIRRTAARLVYCGAMTFAAVAGAQEVVPDFYREPGIYPNRDYLNQHVTEHIDPFAGALQLHFVDIHIPGPAGFDISFTRSYSSNTFINAAAEPRSNQASAGPCTLAEY